MILKLEVTAPHASQLGASCRRTFQETGGIIGRDTRSDWVLPHVKVSARHALVSFAHGTFYIQDSSTNGTFLNSKTNQLSSGRPQELASGDRLFIEPYEILVSIEGHASESRGLPFGQSGPAFRPWPSQEFADPIAPDEERDPLKLLGGAPVARPRAENSAKAREADAVPLIQEHYAPPVVRAVQPPSPHSPESPRASLIPADYDPFAPEDPFADPFEAGAALIAPPRAEAPRDEPVSSPADSIAATSPVFAVPELPTRAAADAGLDPLNLLGFSAPHGSAPHSASTNATPESLVVPLTLQEGTPAPRPASTQSQTPVPAPSVVPSSVPNDPHLVSLSEVMAGAGLEGVAATADLARNFGRIFRIVVSGVMDVLRARYQIKDEFRMRVTHVRPTDNNPLKFSANVDDALHNLLVKKNAAFLEPVAAFDDAFTDLRHHQIAMLAGMRTAYEAMLAQFDPDRLQEHFDQQLKAGRGLGLPARLRYWEQYRDLYERTNRDPDVSFSKLFGEEFARAYEEQFRKLTEQAKTDTR